MRIFYKCLCNTKGIKICSKFSKDITINYKTDQMEKDNKILKRIFHKIRNFKSKNFCITVNFLKLN